MSNLSLIINEVKVLGSQCPGYRLKGDELKRRGWMRQFTTDEPRLSEAVELYESLGYEVHLEPVSFNEASEACKTCLLADCSRYKTIYIRRKSKGSSNIT